MRSSGQAAGLSPFPSSRLAEYRALQQVLAHANLTGCSAEQVVRDALIGGVVTAYHDQRCRCANHVFLPSSKCLPLLSELLAEGAFSPGLSSVPEGGSQQRLSPRVEMGVESLFAVIVLLFSDCFLDGAVCSPPVSAPTSPHEHTLGDAVPADDRACATVLLTEPLCVEPCSPAEASFSNSREGSSARRYENALNSSATTMNRQRSTTSPAPFLAGPAQVFTEDHTAVAEAVATSSVAVDLLTLHQERLTVAVVLLAVINDSLHAVQMRRLLVKSDPSRSAAGASLTLAQSALDDTLVTALLFYKALTVNCLCATEAAYVPGNTIAWLDPLATVQPTDLEETPYHAHQQLSPVRLLRIYPRSHLVALVGHPSALDGECVAMALSRSGEDAQNQFDAGMERLCEEYQALTHRTQPDLGTWLSALKQSALATTRAHLTHAPRMILCRPIDGVPAVVVSPLENVTWRRAKLPSLPLQPGELSFFPADLPQLFVLDSTTSPLASLLALAATTKLGDVQLRNEVEPYLVDHTWHSLTPCSRRLLERLSTDKAELSRTLEKNPVLLARLVVWIRSSASVEETEAARVLSDRVDHYVLFETTFSVSAGRYLRELVTRGAVEQSTVERWLLRCAAQGVPGTLLKIVTAIAEFAAIRSQWKYSEDATQALHQVKHTSP